MAMWLLAGSFFLAVAGITVASTMKSIRLGLQLTAIYFAVFLVLPGYHHTSINAFPFYQIHYPEYIRLQASAIVLAFLLAFYSGYWIGGVGTRSQPLRRIRFRSRLTEFQFNRRFSVLTVLLSITATLLIGWVLGVSGMFGTRSASTDNSPDIDTAGLGLLVSLPRSINFVCLVYAILCLRFSNDRRRSIIFTILSLGLFLIGNWPLALSRFNFFGYILCILVVVCPIEKVKVRALLSVLFVGGALIIMPLFDALTRGGQSVGEIDLTNRFETFLESGDFDGFQSINNAVIYISASGPRWGRQLLSAALFFVPREIWTAKAEPSGSIAAEAAGYRFLNISQPLPGELFIDFSWAGMIVGGAALGFMLRRADNYIERTWQTDPRTRLLAGLLVAFAIIVYRGPLLGVVGPIILTMLLSYLVARVGMRRPAKSSPVRRIFRLGPHPIRA